MDAKPPFRSSLIHDKRSQWPNLKPISEHTYFEPKMFSVVLATNLQQISCCLAPNLQYCLLFVVKTTASLLLPSHMLYMLHKSCFSSEWQNVLTLEEERFRAYKAIYSSCLPELKRRRLLDYNICYSFSIFLINCTIS